MAAKTRSRRGSTQNELAQCDLEFPALQKQVSGLESAEFDAQVYATSAKGKGKRGLNWEVLPNQKTASGGIIASIRITDKFRVRVTRDAVFMRFISLHPDNDSAYRAGGVTRLRRRRE